MRLLVFLFSLLAIASCSKEAEIVPKLEFENIYEIKSDSNDPVMIRAHEIYKKYKVPVFFNDTIAQVFVMEDVKGQPIYHTERVNLEWSFFGYDKTFYDYVYMTTNAEKLEALGIIESFLEKSAPALYPFSFLVVKSARKMEQDIVREQFTNGRFLIGFRTLLMSGNWTAATKLAQPESMKREMIINKINNYSEDVVEFGAVSNVAWYGRQMWNTLDPSIPYGWNYPNALNPSWTGAQWYTAQELEDMRNAARPVIGRFGFVRGNSSAIMSPSNVAEDLTSYVSEMLQYSHDEFVQLWGASPLVMKKYIILKNVIENKMNVKL